MKKGKVTKVKRVLAFVLVFSMILSLGSAVFAADADAVTELEQRLEAYSESNLNSDAGKQLAADYKALSDAQKERIDVALAMKLIYAAYMSMPSADKGSEEAFSAGIAEVLGEFTPRQKEGRALMAVAYGKEEIEGVKLSSSTKFVDEKNPETAAKNNVALDALNKLYREASDYAKDFADWNTYSGGYVRPSSKAYFYPTKNVITLNYNREIQTNPWKGMTQEQKDKYENNENVYKDSLYQKAIQTVGFSQNTKAGFDAGLKLAEAYKYFWANNYDASKLESALAGYDALSSAQRYPIDNITSPSMVATYKSIADYQSNTITMQTYAKIVEYARGAVTMSYVQPFIDLVNSIEAPYNNDHVRQTLEAYGKISGFVYGLIPAETMEKYEAIQAAYIPVAPATPSEEQPDISGFEPTEYNYSQGVNRARAQQALDAANTMLSGLGLDLPALLSEGVYTNKTVTDVIALVYGDLLQGVLAGAGFGGLSFMVIAPSRVANYLKGEEKFSGIYGKLSALTQMTGWKTIETANGDWGFQDGDQEGFVNALSAGLRRVLDLLTNGYSSFIGPILKLNNTIAGNGDFVYGAYEDLIPILEGLGLEGIISSEEYTAAYDETEGNAKYDALLLPILRPVFGLVEKIANDPVNTLLDLLPRLGKLVDDGTLNTQLQKVLARITAFELPAIDMTADGLNELLDGLLAGIQIGADPDAEIEGVSLTYQAIDFASFAGMGTLEVKDSVSAYNLYRSDIKADRATAFAALLDYVLGFTQANAGALDTILGGIEALAPYKELAMSILSDKETGTTLLYSILAPVKNVTVTDPATNITVEGDSATLPSDVEVKVEVITSGEAYEQVKEALKDSAEKFIVYDFAFTSNGVEVHPDGSVTVKIPVPAGYDVNHLAVYHVLEDGTLAKVEFQVIDGMIVFTADSFSSYVVAQNKVNAPNPEEPTQKPDDITGGGEGGGTPETGDAAIGAVVFAAIVAGAGIVLLKKKKHD